MTYRIKKVKKWGIMFSSLNRTYFGPIYMRKNTYVKPTLLSVLWFYNVPQRKKALKTVRAGAASLSGALPSAAGSRYGGINLKVKNDHDHAERATGSLPRHCSEPESSCRRLDFAAAPLYS